MRVLIVEDQGMFRDLLAQVCRAHLRHERVEAVGSGEAAISLMARESFDLAILDIDLPGSDGFSVAEKAAALGTPPAVIGMSAYCDEFMVHRVMTSSLHGFLDKSEQSVETLRDAISAVLKGHYYFSAPVKRMQIALREDPFAFPKLLSDQECELLTLFGAGLNNDDIARRVRTASSTVQWHRKQIMKKLDLHSSVDLVLFAVEKGFTHRGGSRPA